jgi:hypothetical protein
MYKICFYVPVDNAEAVKNAVFAAGAGRIGDYEQCCWQSEGVGQFLPKDNANPHIGSVGKVEQLAELKVEMVCDDANIRAALLALIEAHPYEEPAYQVWQVLSIEDLS